MKDYTSCHDSVPVVSSGWSVNIGLVIGLFKKLLSRKRKLVITYRLMIALNSLHKADIVVMHESTFLRYYFLGGVKIIRMWSKCFFLFTIHPKQIL